MYAVVLLQYRFVPLTPRSSLAPQRFAPLIQASMGKNPQFGVRVRFELFVDGIGKMFPWW